MLPLYCSSDLRCGSKTKKSLPQRSRRYVQKWHIASKQTKNCLRFTVCCLFRGTKVNVLTGLYYRESSLGENIVSDKFCFSHVCLAEHCWRNRSNHYDLDQTKKFQGQGSFICLCFSFRGFVFGCQRHDILINFACLKKCRHLMHG